MKLEKDQRLDVYQVLAKHYKANPDSVVGKQYVSIGGGLMFMPLDHPWDWINKGRPNGLHHYSHQTKKIGTFIIKTVK